MGRKKRETFAYLVLA